MNRKAHNGTTKALIPSIPMRLINAVNEALDAPARELGPSHRRYYHDIASASLVGASVAMKMGYPAHWGMTAAMAHLAEDGVSDQMVKVKLGRGLTLKRVFDELTR